MAWVNPTTRATGYLVPASVWNSDVVANPIALRAGESAWGVEQTTTSTGTQNDFSLSSISTYLRCNNATALVLTGFSVAGAAPPDGARVIVHNVGSSTVRVADQDSGSTAGYRAIHPSTRGQIIGANGAIGYVYDTTTNCWRMEWVEPGAPIAVAHSSGDYTANGSMTWTVESGDLTAFKYRQSGKIVWVSVLVETSSVGGTPDQQLLITLPNSFVSTVATGNLPAFVRDNGTNEVGPLSVAASGTTLRFFRSGAANWSASANNTSVGTNLMLEVN